MERQVLLEPYFPAPWAQALVRTSHWEALTVRNRLLLRALNRGLSMGLMLQRLSRLLTASSCKTTFSGSYSWAPPRVCVNPTPVFVFSLQEAMPVYLSPAACCVSLRPTTAEAAGVQKGWAAVSSPLETWCVTALRATRGRTTRVSKKVWPHPFPPFSPFPPDLSVS